MAATTSARRLVVHVLLALALAGAAIRLLAPNPSLLRDIGSLLLVLWLPVIGNVVAFFVRKIPMPAPKLAFDAASPFTAQLRIAFTPVDPQPARPPPPEGQPELLTLVIGREGFNARAASDVASTLSAAQEMELEFLYPARALPRFPAGTPFLVLVGSVAVGRGTVAAVLA